MCDSCIAEFSELPLLPVKTTCDESGTQLKSSGVRRVSKAEKLKIDAHRLCAGVEHAKLPNVLIADPGYFFLFSHAPQKMRSVRGAFQSRSFLHALA